MLKQENYHNLRDNVDIISQHQTKTKWNEPPCVIYRSWLNFNFIKLSPVFFFFLV